MFKFIYIFSYNQAILLNPESKVALNKKGLALNILERYDEAIKWFLFNYSFIFSKF